MISGGHRCPIGLASKLSRLYLLWYGYWIQKEYPCPGGLLDQPVKYVEAMHIISGVERDWNTK